MTAPVAVVTGGGNGLGLGLGTHLAARGHRLVLGDIDASALDQAAAALGAGRAEVITLPTDVTKGEQVTALAQRTLDAFGRVDVVCLNAGVAMRGRAWALREEDWRWMYDVNVFGVVHGIRSFVPLLIEQRSGHVLITASNSSVMVLSELAPYVSTKHAVLSIGESLQHDLREIGSPVRVSVVLPSIIRSTMADGARNRPSDYGTIDISPDVLETTRELLAVYGEDPSEMADRILREALDDGRFYVFTEPSDTESLLERTTAIRSGALAPVATPTIHARI